MPRRLTAKRIDYSKFGASGSSSASDDDDFEIVPAAPKKPKVSTKDKKEGIEKENVDKKRNKSSDTTTTTAKTRNTRTSNAENVYEKELLVALEMSKTDFTDNKSESSECTTNNADAILLEDSDDEKVMKIIKGLTETQGSTSNIDSEGSAFADTLPIGDRKHFSSDEKNTTSSSMESPIKLPYLKKDKGNKQNSSDSSENPKSTRETLQRSRVENIGNVSRANSAPPSVKPSPKASSLNNTSTSNFTVLTPGRLRLGLSRNVRVSKPLHENVNIKSA